MRLVVRDRPGAVGNKDAFPDREGAVEPHQQEIQDRIQKSKAKVTQDGSCIRTHAIIWDDADDTDL